MAHQVSVKYFILLGCGKTFLMNLFYDSIDIKEKQRIHFNEFMLNIHKEIHRYHKKVIISNIILSRNKTLSKELQKIEQESSAYFAWMSFK
jgi:predicted ATPase